MKNILKYLLLCCSALSLFGCEDYLDKTPQGDKTEEDVFTRFNETEQLINRLYFYVRAADQPLVHIRYFSDSALADECEGSSAENGWSNKFNEGDWEPGAELYSKCNATTDAGACHTFWPALYQDIRCANVILEGIEKYNTPDSQVHPGTLSQRIGEVYFLRAYLHYCVLKSYGECPTWTTRSTPTTCRNSSARTSTRSSKDMQRLRQRLFACSGALSGRAVRPCGEGYLPGIESHGALDRRHAALQRLDAQRR